MNLTDLEKLAKAARDEPRPYVAEFLKFNYMANPETILSMIALMREMGDAVYGLSFGADWNNGTHAIKYRQAVLSALAKYKEMMG
jgi:hypothetical protein